VNIYGSEEIFGTNVAERRQKQILGPKYFFPEASHFSIYYDN
jgi:hypothetical protein